MKCTRIYFERTKSEPGFCNRKAGIEIELAENDKASDVLKKAECFVAYALNESPSPQQISVALEIMERGKNIDDLPF